VKCDVCSANSFATLDLHMQGRNITGEWVLQNFKELIF